MGSQIAADGKAQALVARFWNEVWNPPYSMDVFDDLVAGDFTINTDGKCIEGKEIFRVWLQEFPSKIRDPKTVPEEILVADGGNRVITRMRVSGFNQGLFGSKYEPHQRLTSIYG